MGITGSGLFVADLFHPLDNFAVELFVNGDMSHGGSRRSAIPMLFILWAPDHVPPVVFPFLDRLRSEPSHSRT